MDTPPEQSAHAERYAQSAAGILGILGASTALHGPSEDTIAALIESSRRMIVLIHASLGIPIDPHLSARDILRGTGLEDDPNAILTLTSTIIQWMLRESPSA